MSENGYSSSDVDQCPICGSGLIDWTEDLGVQWCDCCEEAYFQYAGDWFILDDGTGRARLVKPETERSTDRDSMSGNGHSSSDTETGPPETAIAAGILPLFWSLLVAVPLYVLLEFLSAPTWSMLILAVVAAIVFHLGERSLQPDTDRSNGGGSQ